MSLVAIFDADKEGFLRSGRSLIQTMGRAARNVNGRVIMYADSLTAAMKQSIAETERRRTLQDAYNKEHGITPATVVRAVMNMNPESGVIDYLNIPKAKKGAAPEGEDLSEQIQALRLEMFAAAENLDFETAARLRDQLKRLEGLGGVAEGAAAPDAGYEPYGAKRKKSGAMKKPSLRPTGGKSPARPSKRPKKMRG